MPATKGSKTPINKNSKNTTPAGKEERLDTPEIQKDEGKVDSQKKKYIYYYLSIHKIIKIFKFWNAILETCILG